MTPTGRRLTHPWAWWCWAIGVAVCASLTTNPLFLLLIAAAVIFVVLWRRTDAPWAMSLKFYLIMAGVIITIRLSFQLILGSRYAGTELFRLPVYHLPGLLAGVKIGGPVTAEALLFSFLDALRLALVLLCIGAANTLANPKRALRSVPAALYEVSVAITVSLSVAPQLIESAMRIRRARRLRGGTGRGWQAIKTLLLPVLEDAIERSLALAAGMEVRGFGRTRRDAPHRRIATVALLVGSALATFGIYFMLGARTPLSVLVALFVVALGLITTGIKLSGAQLAVTHYRPDPWRVPEWLVVACGLGTALIGVRIGSTDPLLISTTALEWPQLHPLMPVAALVAALPAVLSPIPPRRALKVG